MEAYGRVERCHRSDATQFAREDYVEERGEFSIRCWPPYVVFQYPPKTWGPARSSNTCGRRWLAQSGVTP